MSSPLKRKAPPKKSLVLEDQKILSDGARYSVYKWHGKYFVSEIISSERHLIGVTIENGQRELSLSEMEDILGKLGMTEYESHMVDRSEEEPLYIHFFEHKARPRSHRSSLVVRP